MERRSISVALASFVLLAGCSNAAAVPSSVGQPTGHPTSGATAMSALATPAEIEMCALVPVGDVQAHSPFSNALVSAKTNVVPGMCTYASAAGAGGPVGVLLAVTAYESASEAMAAHAVHEQDEVSLGTPPTQISGLGDAASSAGQDEVGVQAVQGNLVIDANLKGEWPAVTDAAKVAAGTALIRLIISRLP